MSVNWIDIATIRVVKKFMNACAFECVSVCYIPAKGTVVNLVPPRIDVPRSLTIADFYEQENRYFVRFEEVSSKKDMQQFDGMHIVAEDDESFEPVSEETYLGWTLVNNGKEYEILDCVEMPTQLLITIEGDIDLPLHEDFIDEVDEENQIIKTHFEDYFFEN